MYISSCGMVTPVGLSFRATAAAMRARISSFAELPFHDSWGEPVYGAFAADVAQGLLGSARLAELATVAILDALDDEWRARAGRLALLLCVSEPGTPGRSPDLEQRLPSEIEKATGLTFHSSESAVASVR